MGEVVKVVPGANCRDCKRSSDCSGIKEGFWECTLSLKNGSHVNCCDFERVER